MKSFIKLNLILTCLSFYFQALTAQANDLQALAAERELHRLVKIKLHGEPLELFGSNSPSAKTIAFSADGKYLAVAYTPGSVLIYDIFAERAKKFDCEIEKMRQEKSPDLL